MDQTLVDLRDTNTDQARRRRIAIAIMGMKGTFGPLRTLEEIFNDIDPVSQAKLLALADEILALI